MSLGKVINSSSFSAINLVQLIQQISLSNISTISHTFLLACFASLPNRTKKLVTLPTKSNDSNLHFICNDIVVDCSVWFSCQQRNKSNYTKRKFQRIWVISRQRIQVKEWICTHFLIQSLFEKRYGEYANYFVQQRAAHVYVGTRALAMSARACNTKRARAKCCVAAGVGRCCMFDLCLWPLCSKQQLQHMCEVKLEME